MCRPTVNKTYIGRRTVGELETLWTKAYEAFSTDDNYVFDMADESLKVAIKRGLEVAHEN